MTTLDHLAAPDTVDATAARCHTVDSIGSTDNSDNADAIDNSISQAARHTTQLAIGRWRLGKRPTEMQLAAALRASAQERWYAHTLTQLDAWRANGGFGKDQQRLDQKALAQ